MCLFTRFSRFFLFKRGYVIAETLGGALAWPGKARSAPRVSAFFRRKKTTRAPQSHARVTLLR